MSLISHTSDLCKNRPLRISARCSALKLRDFLQQLTVLLCLHLPQKSEIRVSVCDKVKFNRSNSPPRWERSGSSSSFSDIVLEKEYLKNVNSPASSRWQPGADSLSFPELSQQLLSASPIWPERRSLRLELSPKLVLNAAHAVRVFLHWL